MARKKAQEVEIEQKPLIDIERDIEFIISFFRYKGISTKEAFDMPEYEFDALFNDLEDSLLGKIANVRYKKRNGIKFEEGEKALYESTMYELTEKEKKEKKENIAKHKQENRKVAEAIARMGV